MRRARSRRIQAQRKFAQGAYVPPNAVNVVAAENRRNAVREARNVTINNMTATSLLDVVSLHSVHSHLTSQPVVLIERLRGRNLERDVPPPSHPEASSSQQPKSTTKKAAEQPKLQVGRNKKDFKRVHAMSLRSRRLSKLEWNKLLAQSCAPLRKTPSKRKKASSDEDEPLIFHKTRKKSPAVAATEDSPCEKSPKMKSSKDIGPCEKSPKVKSTKDFGHCEKSPKVKSSKDIGPCEKSPKVKSSKDIDVPRKTKAKENKSKEIETNPGSSKLIRENSAKKKKCSPQKTIPKECSPKKPAITASKKHLTTARDELVNEAALDNVVTRNDLAMANPAVVPEDLVVVTLNPKVVPGITKAAPVKPKLVSIKPTVIPVKPKVIPVKAKVIPVKPVAVSDALVVVSDTPVGIPDAPVIVPDAPVVVPDAPVVVPDAPVFVPYAPVVDSDAPVVDPDAPVVDADAPVVVPDAPVVKPKALAPNAMVVLPYRTVSFVPYAEVETETPEQKAAYLARMDEALIGLDDLPDLENFSEVDDETTVRVQHVAVQPANQSDIADQDHPCPSLSMVHNEVPLKETDTVDQERSNGYLDSALVYGSDTSDDEPMVRVEAPVKQVHRRTNDSPAPGPSGMQCQSSKNNSDANEEDGGINLTSLIKKILAGPSGMQSILLENNSDIDEDSDQGKSNKIRTIIKRILDSASVNLQLEELVKASKTCVAATWRTEQDVINASKEQVDSRCKVCKPCHTYEKILRGNRNDLDSSIEAPEKELNRQNSEAECSAMGNEKRTVAADTDDGNVRFKVPSGNSNVAKKVRTPVINAQAIMGMNSEKNGDSKKNKQLQGKKHELGKQKGTQNYNKNVNSDSAVEKQASEETDTQHIQQKEGDDRPPVAQKKNLEVEISHITQRFEELRKEKEKEIARLKIEIRSTVRAEMEADRRMIEEVDRLAQTLDKEEDAKSMLPRQFPDLDEPGTSGSANDGTLVDAPVYFPTLEEFNDPVSFFEKIYPEAMKYGVCKVVPPPGWMPPSAVHGDIRFDIMNQYISRLFSRWGPAARELSAIKLCLSQYTNINFTRPPQLDGVEINLPKLYHLVQRLGGLETVINKNRWSKVADDLKITKAGNYEKRLDNIYMKFLLAYDTLSHQERQEIMRKVEVSWNKKNQKLLDRAMHPLYRQQRMLGLLDSSDEETEDENIKTALKQAEDCIIKGHIMQHSRFKKVATMAYENTFGPGSEAASPPSLDHIEEMYWRLVTSGTEHVCVHTAAIDTGLEGHGFTTTEEPYASHPWNPKQVINNPRNILRYLGPVVGVTVPTLLLGMLFSTSCWHKDPHGVAWYEYQSKGPTRIWYGIPADQADNFRKAVETLSPTSCQNKALWLSSEIAMIPPSALREHNVRLTRVTQNEGEFIMAFPNAYTSCISTGYTESESVYLASSHWLDYMWNAFKVARDSCEPTMFSMEQLLYNIGRDKDADPDLVRRALPMYDLVLREEVTNRQMLQERGIPFVQQLLSAQGEQQSSTDSARPLEECDYCRSSLFLSKVKGLLARNSVMCLEHALALLDSDKIKDLDERQVQLLVLVSVKELHKVHDDMRRRQNTKS